MWHNRSVHLSPHVHFSETPEELPLTSSPTHPPRPTWASPASISSPPLVQFRAATSSGLVSSSSTRGTLTRPMRTGQQVPNIRRENGLEKGRERGCNIHAYYTGPHPPLLWSLRQFSPTSPSFRAPFQAQGPAPDPLQIGSPRPKQTCYLDSTRSNRKYSTCSPLYPQILKHKYSNPAGVQACKQKGLYKTSHINKAHA